jgi:nitric oxide reductase subunit C
MTKRQTRMFFIGGTVLFFLIFIALTIDTHRQIPALTNTHLMTDQVVAGKKVFYRENCINCHTLMGEGSYYAPDLTKITQLRGAGYLTAFLQDPSRFYSEREHRRLMPNPNLSDEKIEQVIAFLDWVSRIDNQGWPPRPILVTGGTFPGTAQVGQRATGAGSTEPVAVGQEVFHASPPGCFACHSTAPGVSLAGPSLAGIASRAERIIQEAGYTGAATDVEGYIRESILQPSAHIVEPIDTYSAAGVSFMPHNAEETLTPEQIEALVAYLMTLR